MVVGQWPRGGLAPRSQWRDRSGFAPDSLFSAGRLLTLWRHPASIDSKRSIISTAGRQRSSTGRRRRPSPVPHFGPRRSTPPRESGRVRSSKHGASAVRLRVRPRAEREAGEKPARSRHCNRALATDERGDLGSQIPAAEEEQTLSVERATPPRCRGAPTRFDRSWSGRGVANLLSTILRVVTIG